MTDMGRKPPVRSLAYTGMSSVVSRIWVLEVQAIRADGDLVENNRYVGKCRSHLVDQDSLEERINEQHCHWNEFNPALGCARRFQLHLTSDRGGRTHAKMCRFAFHRRTSDLREGHTSISCRRECGQPDECPAGFLGTSQ